ncbi:elongation factor 1-gamma [Rhodnius prolixus]|uniref:Elongation factor 1-gamma n=1 Tax=Rhodnius prolixus TaxID=13249 RepID=R4FNR5_RHOPR
MASGTLYTIPDNFRTYKVLIAAQYGGGGVKVAPEFVFGETNKTPDFLKKFPHGKVPAFMSSKGEYITESNAIAYFVSSSELRGKTDTDKAHVIQWLSYADTEVLPYTSAFVFPYMGMIELNKQAVANAKNELKNVFQQLNQYLLTRTYLVGEEITLADIVLACTLLNAYKYVLDPNFRKPYQNVNRWFSTITNQPKVKNVIGTVKLCEKEPEVPKSSESGGKKEGKKKGGSGDQKELPPKQEQPKPAQPEELDETELALAAEPKSKDPFSALPPGSFNMDDFKRAYSNQDTDKSIPYFWEKFDKDNYSIWLGEYKYNDELKKVFMSCNLITGMFQRLDKMRKHAFASVCLFGKDDDSTISGIWIWRGHNLAFELSPDLQVDYESYTWSKLNSDDASHKKMINEYLDWTCKDKAGRSFTQGKIFK